MQRESVMRKRVFSVVLLSIFAVGLLLSQAARATSTDGTTYPKPTVIANAHYTSATGVVIDYAAVITPQQNPNGKTWTWTGGPPFNWQMTMNPDPFIDWSVSATDPGHYDIIFEEPIIGAPYYKWTNSAHLSATGTVTGVSIIGELDATSMPTLSGDLLVPGTLDYGPATITLSSGSPALMDVHLVFDLVSGSADFNGRLSAVPTPSALAAGLVLGLGLLGRKLISARKKA